mmetsp:Transcript_10478/g.18316  ORF Transcript_10478/g.18316 Transcript_10478/m.18316 type:complete len:201 (+) Transcript_10478:849-1451(+)
MLKKQAGCRVCRQCHRSLSFLSFCEAGIEITLQFINQVLTIVPVHHVARLVRSDKLTPSKLLPERHKHVATVTGIVGSQNLLNRYRGFLGVVEGHVGEEMMGDMRVRNVMEDVVKNSTITPVHCGHSASQPVPILVIVMGQVGVCVLQIRDHHQPVIDDKQWDDVHLQKPDKTLSTPDHAQPTKNKCQHSITCQHFRALP